MQLIFKNELFLFKAPNYLNRLVKPGDQSFIPYPNDEIINTIIPLFFPAFYCYLRRYNHLLYTFLIYRYAAVIHWKRGFSLRAINSVFFVTTKFTYRCLNTIIFCLSSILSAASDNIVFVCWVIVKYKLTLNSKTK